MKDDIWMSHYFNFGLGAYIYKKAWKRVFILGLIISLALYFLKETKQSTDYKFPLNMFALLLFVLLILTPNTASFYYCFWKGKKRKDLIPQKATGLISSFLPQ